MHTTLSVVRLLSLDFEPRGEAIDCGRGSLVNETKKWPDNRLRNHRREHAHLERNILEVLTPLLAGREGLAFATERVGGALAQPGRVLFRIERLCLHFNQSKLVAPLLNDVSASKAVSCKESGLKDSEVIPLERFPRCGGSHERVTAVLPRHPLRVVELRQCLNHVATFGKHGQVVVFFCCVWIAELSVIELCGTRAGRLEVGLGEGSEAIFSSHRNSLNRGRSP